MTVRIEGEGIVLREWTEDDVPVMSELFDDPVVAHWTPLPSPFDAAAAAGLLTKIRGARAEGTRLHLAITKDGGEPLGEVMISVPARSLGYAVGAAHRGQGLAPRAARLLTAYAHGTLGLPRLLLQIEPGNAASEAVARAAGYRLTDEEPIPVEDKGRAYTLRTWAHDANSATAVDLEALTALAEGHHPRAVRSFGVRETAGHLVKVYGIEAPGRTVTEADLAPALRIAADRLAGGSRYGSLGLAVLLVHAGGDGDYVLVHTWIEGHMSDLSVHVGPAGRPDELRPGRVGLAPCVWEAAVLAHERESFVRHVLDGEGPWGGRLDAWGADVIEGVVR